MREEGKEECKKEFREEKEEERKERHSGRVRSEGGDDVSIILQHENGVGTTQPSQTYTCVTLKVAAEGTLQNPDDIRHTNKESNMTRVSR